MGRIGVHRAELALAHAGLLNNRLHTSNGAGFYREARPRIRGSEYLCPLRSVRDGGVITANGLAPFTFAAEIFRALVRCAPYQELAKASGVTDEALDRASEKKEKPID